MHTNCYKYCGQSVCSGTRTYYEYEVCNTYDSNGEWLYEKTYNNGCKCVY